MGNPHGCEDCKEYGRKLDQALAMRIEDSKSYNLDLKELRQEKEDITEEKELWRKLGGERGLEIEQLKAEVEMLREEIKGLISDKQQHDLEAD